MTKISVYLYFSLYHHDSMTLTFLPYHGLKYKENEVMN